MPCQIPEVICVWSCRHVFVFISNGNEVTHQQKGIHPNSRSQGTKPSLGSKKGWTNEQIHFLGIRWSPTKDLFYRHKSWFVQYFTANILQQVVRCSIFQINVWTCTTVHPKTSKLEKILGLSLPHVALQQNVLSPLVYISTFVGTSLTASPTVSLTAGWFSPPLKAHGMQNIIDTWMPDDQIRSHCLYPSLISHELHEPEFSGSHPSWLSRPMSQPWTQIPGAERKTCWDCWPERSSSSMSSPLRM